MASGKLGISAPSANTNTVVYTVPAGKVATLNITATNRGEQAAGLNVALSTSASPVDAEWIEYGVAVPAKGVLERTGLVCGEGEKVMVSCTSANFSVRVNGFEENV